jgi:hypothetical protein
MRPSVDVRRAAAALLIAAIGAAVPLPAGATTFVLMDERDLAARSVAAVLGTVTSVQNQATATGGGIVTAVVIEPERVLFGALPSGPVILHEPGGTIGSHSERVFGSAQYSPGERVVAFLSRDAGGSLHTTGMAMGKYRVVEEAAGERLTRNFDDDVAVLDPTSGHLRPAGKPDATLLSSVVERLRDLAAARLARSPGPAIRRGLPAPVSPAFTYLDQPSRWFEPDDGLSIRFRIDSLGDAGVGAAASIAAAQDALAAWSSVAGSSLTLVSDSLDQPLPFAGCDGDTRVVFNDPFGEIGPPVDCHGVVGIGGFCTMDQTREVNGTTFHRIGLGKVLMAAGFEGCPFWNACSLGEVLTHEVGHAIGFGHSADPNATMWAAPHFDGRCASIASDDIDAVRFTYPFVPSATPTPTATPLPSSPTATRTNRPTRTPTVNTTPRRAGHNSVSGSISYYGTDLPVADVAVAARGAVVQSTSTTTDGRYAFPDIPEGGCAIQPSKSGDTGVAISALDAAWVLQAVTGRRRLTDTQALACDVTGSGAMSSLDAAWILRRAVGDAGNFPAADLCGSEWLFLPAPVPLSGQRVVLPAFAAGACQSGVLMLEPLQGVESGQDFSAVALGDCTGNWQPSDADGAAERQPSPAGTALEMQPLQARPGGRWMQPIAVRAPADVYALELELRYDATRAQLGRVRAVHVGDPTIALARAPEPGRVYIALASAAALPIDGRAVVVAEFTGGPHLSDGFVSAVAAVVDERQVALPAP